VLLPVLQIILVSYGISTDNTLLTRAKYDGCFGKPREHKRVIPYWDNAVRYLQKHIETRGLGLRITRFGVRIPAGAPRPRTKEA